MPAIFVHFRHMVMEFEAVQSLIGTDQPPYRCNHVTSGLRRVRFLTAPSDALLLIIPISAVEVPGKVDRLSDASSALVGFRFTHDENSGAEYADWDGSCRL